MKIDITKKQIEKELLKGIEETGITCMSRELLDDKRIAYLVLASQLLGLRQGFDTGRQEIIEEIKEDLIIKLSEDRGKSNELIAINFGNDFKTNSIEILKDKLKEELSKLQQIQLKKETTEEKAKGKEE